MKHDHFQWIAVWIDWIGLIWRRFLVLIKIVLCIVYTFNLLLHNELKFNELKWQSKRLLKSNDNKSQKKNVRSENLSFFFWLLVFGWLNYRIAHILNITFKSEKDIHHSPFNTFKRLSLLCDKMKNLQKVALNVLHARVHMNKNLLKSAKRAIAVVCRTPYCPFV